MKIKHFFMLMAISLAVLSCSEDEMYPNPSENNSTETNSTKADIVSPTLGTTSTSNPDLYDNWENIEDIFFNNNPGGVSVKAPWITEQGSPINIPDNIRMDIKKEDGWIMLGHTMENLLVYKASLMLFYNKKCGILKGFYFKHGGENNQNFKWVLSSIDKPSSLIPANTREYHTADKAEEYAISSNLLFPSSVVSSIGAVRDGWNCFTFELPYGEINNKNPLIRIDGYNIEKSIFNGTGELAGQVIVPGVSTTNKLADWNKYLGSISSISGAINGFSNALKPDKKDTTNTKPKTYQYNEKRSVIGIIAGATAIISSVVGAASHFTSKTENVTHRYQMSGNIKLTGDIIKKLSGAITVVSHIDINKLNNEQALGVWGLKKTPELTIDKYDYAARVSSDDDLHKRKIYLSLRNIDKESVIINPSLLNDIESYSVTTSNLYASKDIQNQMYRPFDSQNNSPYQKVTDDWYLAKIDKPIEITKHIIGGGFPELGKPNAYYLSYRHDKFPEAYIDVTVTINYKDGSEFISTRMFKIDGTVRDNRQEIIDRYGRYENCIFM